jgi:hypothetical protein
MPGGIFLFELSLNTFSRRTAIMNIRSERGQAVLPLALLGLIAFAIVYFGLLANQGNITQGAEAIGDAAGEMIDAYEQELRNIDWQMLHGTVVSAWVNNQRIHPNKHAVESHGEYQASLATNCYNDHGVFFIQANKAGDWYLHCLEEDGFTVRTTFWTKDGNKFHMQSAYTKGDGAWSWTQIRTFFENKWGATGAKFPSDGVLYIDGAPAPYMP